MRFSPTKPAAAPGPALADVSMVDLADLPSRGSLAIAVRCVHRLAPCFQLPADFEDRDACQSIYDAALARATHFAAGGADDGERLEELVQVAYQMAELTAEATHYGGYAVAHAVQAVVHAREVDAGAEGNRKMQLVAAVFGACRVVIQRCRSLGSEAGLIALRADLETLKDVPCAPGIDPSDSGPLGSYWPDGPPPGL